jgi:hypothetical protein
MLIVRRGRTLAPAGSLGSVTTSTPASIDARTPSMSTEEGTTKARRKRRCVRFVVCCFVFLCCVCVWGGGWVVVFCV